jgi:hypothetical protein
MYVCIYQKKYLIMFMRMWVWLEGNDLGKNFLSKLGKVYRRARSSVPETDERVWGFWWQWKKRKVCKDRSKWKELISAYPKGKRAWCYVCMFVYRLSSFHKETRIGFKTK